MNNFFRKKEWWESLAANFFGALLGIIVTFGTANYLENREKQAMGRTSALMTISDIELSIHELERDCKQFEADRAIYSTVLSHYPDELDQVPLDTLSLYVNSFFTTKYFVVNPSAEGIFAHSSDIWRVLDNHTLQQRIGHCFALRNMLNSLAIQIRNQIQEAGRGFFMEKYFSDREDFRAAVKELTARPGVRHYLTIYPIDVDWVIEKLHELKQMNERNKRDMNITDEELAKYLEFAREKYGTSESEDSAE